MRDIMTTISKVALALAGVAGLALAAESAHAQLVLNGAGSAAGRYYAVSVPVLLCAASPTPLLFVSSGNPPNLVEWQCTINGVANSRIRYSATNTVDAFIKQPPGAVGTATYLNTASCPAGFFVTIFGRPVLKSVCPAATPTQILPVHWGGSDVSAGSLRQTAFGLTQIPPLDSHLTTTATVIIPFSIVVGGGVAGAVSLAHPRLSQVFKHAGGLTSWGFLGLAATPPTIVTVDSKLTCPVYVAHDLSGSSCRVFQPRADIWSRTVALGSTILGTFDPWVGPLRARWARPVSISRPSAW